MTLAGVFGPLGQVFIFVLGSAIALSAITVLAAFLLRGTRTNVDLVQTTLVILPQVITDGLVRGFLFAIIALGYTMVYGVLEFINFAHGEIFMVGAFSGAALGTALAASGMLNAIPPLLFVLIAVAVGMIVSGMLAMTIERVAYRPLRNALRLVPLISAIGVSLLLQDGMRLIANVTGLGFNARFPAPNFGPPLQLAQIPAAAGRTIPLILDVRAVIFIVAATLMLIGLNYLVNATKLGTAICAVAQDRPTASLMGINVNQIIALTFLIGGALSGASYADIVAFAILILILVFRPSGLLGEAVAQKV